MNMLPIAYEVEMEYGYRNKISTIAQQVGVIPVLPGEYYQLDKRAKEKVGKRTGKQSHAVVEPVTQSSPYDVFSREKEKFSTAKIRQALYDNSLLLDEEQSVSRGDELNLDALESSSGDELFDY